MRVGRAIVFTVVGIASVVALSGLGASGSAAPPVLTFLVASDTHFGATNLDRLNRVMIEQMNALPGTPYPEAIGGRVDAPRGLLVLGDIADDGNEPEWRQFVQMYGLTGRDALLRYPVYETVGNHDLIWESPVKAGVERRHGSVRYAWDWGDVRLLSLGMYPGDEARAWLAQQLARAGRQRRVVLFFHYAIMGPHSDDWTEPDKAAFAKTIDGYNVVAIFHGHYHCAGNYEWRGHRVFRPGSPRHSCHSFLAVRIAARELSVATWDFDRKAWGQPQDQFTGPLQP